MKLTAKLVVVFVLGIMVLIAINGYLAIRRETRLFAKDAADDAERLGSAMESMVKVVWENKGPVEALKMIRETTAHKYSMRIRWVWFDAVSGDPYEPQTPRERFAAVKIEKMVSFTVPDAGGGESIHAYWPITVDHPRRGGLELSKPTTLLEEKKRQVVVRTATLMIAMTLLTALLATVVGVGFVGRPLQRLIEKTRRVADGDLSGPIELNSHDELSQLAGSLNSMCEQLATSKARVEAETATRVAAMEQLRHADRLRTVGRLASGVAHELGTPLNVISGRANLIASGRLDDEQRTTSARTIKAEADRMAGTIRQLLDFARRNAPRKASVDLRHVAQQTIDLLSPLAEKRKIRLHFEAEEGEYVAMVDVGQAQQVLTNLIVNAVHASPDGGAVTVRLRRAHVDPPDSHEGPAGEYDCISVEDHGPGIEPENIEHLFEPFFTTKDVGEGTGLGLSIAYGIVQEHDGWIDVESRIGEGSVFRVYVPVESRS